MATNKTNPGHKRPQRPDLVGVILDDRYRLNSIRNQGGMGEIWSAEDLKFKQSCLVKLLPADLSGKSLYTDALMREAQLTKSLPSEVTPFVGDMGVCDGLAYYVMDQLQGNDLETLLEEHYPTGMSALDFVPFFSKILKAVAILHSKGVIHRDLKPENIFTKGSSEGQGASVRVIDFGIAQSSRDEFSVLDEIRFTGTAKFTPPECQGNEGQGRATQSVDVFALGLIAYRMILGRKEFNNLNYKKFYSNEGAFTDLFTDPSGKRAGLHESLCKVLSSAVAFESSERPQDAGAMLEEFNSANEFHPECISPGTVLDNNYRVLEFFDKGGMGAVYLVEDIHRPTEENLLLKILTAPLNLGKRERQESKERFRSESITLHSLKHPNIPHIFDNSSHDNIPFLVMEQAQGETLDLVFDKLMEQGGWEAIFGMANQVANALDSVHEEGIIHRDIKPANIIVNPENGIAFVVDFGLARLDRSNLTGIDVQLGTPGFSSPEQFLGKSCPQSDQWSFAACFYALLTGFRAGCDPIEGSQLEDDDDIRQKIFDKVVGNDLLPLAGMPKLYEVPDGVIAAISMAMSFDPKDRFENTTQFVDAMIVGAGGQLAPRPEKAQTIKSASLGHHSVASLVSPQKSTHASKRKYLLPAILVGLALGVSGYFFSAKGEKSDKLEVASPVKEENTKLSKVVTDQGESEIFTVSIRAVENGKPVEGIEINSEGHFLKLPSQKEMSAGRHLATVLDSKFAGPYDCEVTKDNPHCLIMLVRKTNVLRKPKKRGSKKKPIQSRIKLNDNSARDKEKSPFRLNPNIKDEE